MKNRVCTPRYRSEPVYDEQCSFRVNRWSVGARKAGSADAALPFWPTAGPGTSEPTPGAFGLNTIDPPTPTRCAWAPNAKARAPSATNWY